LETLECLKVVLKFCPQATVIVLDNDSRDGSLGMIARYLGNKGETFFQMREEDVEAAQPYSLAKDREKSSRRVILIQNRKNHGYGGGNNVGIKLALADPDCAFVWILNNDAIIDSDTLSSLLSVAEDKKVGFVGSVIRYMDRPDVIQCYGGGKVLPLLGKCRLYMKNDSISDLSIADERNIDYVMGASLLVRRELIDEVGLMDPSYFMYSEEVDWQYRAKRKGWGIAVAPSSFIYHSDSQSTRESSHIFHYLRNRSAIMFTRRFYGPFIAVIAVVNLSCIIFLQNWKCPKHVAYGIKGSFDGLFKRFSQFQAK
jgi:GT2 family glycosyltransferase